MKAVIYARFSSEKQNEASIEGQLRECLEYAEYNKIEVIGNYIDRACSARTANRPDFQRMIKDSYKHNFDCVIVWKLDRFARDRYDSAYYKNILKKNGVQERIAVNKKAPAMHRGEDDYLLTTKLHCGKCGALMTGEIGTGRKDIKYRYYKCVRSRKKLCDKKPVKKEWLENLVIEQILGLLADDKVLIDLADRIYEMQGEESGTVKSLQAQLNDTNKKLNNMITAMSQGIFSDSTKKFLDELEQQKQNLEIELLEEKTKHPIIPKEQILFTLKNYKKIDTSTKEGKQKLIDSFVNSIYLYDDRFVITFNYKGESKTVTLDDINSSSLTSTGSPLKSLGFS